MSLKNSYVKVTIWVGVLMSLALFLAPYRFVEIVYSRGIFVIMRLIFSPLVLLPVPLIYLLVAYLLYTVWKLFTIKRTLSQRVVRLLINLTVVLLLFYWMWAFNYRRLGFDKRYPLVFSHSLDSLAMTTELNLAISGMIESRPIQIDLQSSHEVEKKIKPFVKSAVGRFGYTTPGVVSVKELWPPGILLRIKTAGFYLPFAGEAYIDAGLHPIQKPFTMAHEMSHGYGITDEGACNFLAFLATINHPDSTIRYSAALGYYRYVAGEYRWRYPQAYQEMRDKLPEMIRQDLDDINRQMLKYPDIFPKWRDKIYDKYLTVQGIKEGMASYNKIIDYVRQARAQGLLGDQ